MFKTIARSVKANKTLRMQILVVAMAFIVMVALSCIFMGSIVRAGLVRGSESILDFTQERSESGLAIAQSVMEGFSATVQGMVDEGAGADELGVYVRDTAMDTAIAGEALSSLKAFRVYLETAPGGPIMITEDGAAPADAGQEDWYLLASEAGGNIAHTSPSIRSSGETTFTYARLLADGRGQTAGAVCIEVRIDTIGADIVNTALDQGGYGMLLNRELLILAHPNTDFVGRYAYDPAVPLSESVAGELQAGRAVSEKPMTSYTGQPAVAFFRQLDNGWYIGLVAPESRYYADMNAMSFVLIVLGAALAAVLIGILIRIDMARLRSDDENKKKSMFLANMSHEIRTPINAIVGMTAIGRAAGSGERKDYCFSKIDTASKHLLGVVNDILDISKIEANKIELSPTDFNFERMLQQAVSVSNFRADEKHQKLTVHIDRKIPKILYADDQRLAQVITNLISNAIKFTPNEGAISLRTELLSEEEDEALTVKVSVTDNGIGISPEQQQRLFRPFQQAESSTTRKYGGTGLGLAISKSIVEMMGGRIWVASEQGKGTTMSFTVRAKRGEASRFDLSLHGVNWENVRIMAVDDDPDILQYFKETVLGFGAKCDVAESAGQALSMLEDNGAYNIYFVDLRMPNVDGISLTRELRAREKQPGNSVVIMISSADLSAVEQDAKSAGVNKFLLKPLFPSAIGDVISECIGIVNDKAKEAPADIAGIFKGKRVLFAEDVEINREIVLTLLEPTGLEIDCAENGVDAVRKFTQAPESYDMIFMDVQMPEMDGYEATRQIRSLACPRAGAVPIVAMTANVFREDIDSCLAAGMNGHLGKPLDLDEVITSLRRYL